MRRNIIALVEGSKQSTEQRQQAQYGKSLPKRGTNSSIDISDILKYTLGVKREKELGIKPEPLVNPFVRVPPRFYDSLGGFYLTPSSKQQ
jgi:hypothetical protein